MAGQGENSFPNFLQELASGARAFTAAGMIWRDGEEVHRNPMELTGHKRGLDWSVIDKAKYKRPPLCQ
jgi:hypothetical protein